MCMLRYTPTRPPPPPGARRLTARPADPEGLGQPRGGGATPPHPLRVTHWLAAAPVLWLEMGPVSLVQHNVASSVRPAPKFDKRRVVRVLCSYGGVCKPAPPPPGSDPPSVVATVTDCDLTHPHKV